MSGPLPHRLAAGKRAGQCRDCGTFDAYSAPETCCRCALQRYDERGYETVSNMVSRFENWNQEIWRQVAHGIRTGAIKSDRFYLYVGHNDGGSLGLPMGDLSPQEWEVPSARIAHETALALTQRYPQVWVVTTVGCWSAVRRGEQS